jgi:predicted anti-sigma-YlaC factor YlaD
MLVKLAGYLHGSCTQAMRVSSDRLDGPVPLSTRAMHRFHLLTCAVCRKATRQLHTLRTVSTHTPDSAESLTPEARERIADQLRDAREP